MSFVPIFTTHSPHIYFAFILHFFMFSLVISALTKALGWARSHMTCKSLTHVIYAVKQRVCGKTDTHMLFPHSEYCCRCERMSVQLQLWKPVADFGCPQQFIGFLFGSGSEVSKSGLGYFLCLSWNVAQCTRLFCSVWLFESLCAEIKTLCVLTLRTEHFCQGPTCLTLLWKTVVLI